MQEATLTAAVAQCKAAVLFEAYISYALSHVEPEVKGCCVEGAWYLLEILQVTESMGLMPCNALSVPDKATVIAIVCDVVQGHAESKVESPCCGLARCLHDTDCAATARDWEGF